MPSRRQSFSQEGADADGVVPGELLVDEAALGALDGEGAQVAGVHGVDAETVADVVEPHDLGEVVDLAEAAEDVGRLVLGTLDHEPLVAPLEDRVALDALEHAGRARLVDGAVLGEHGLDGDALEVLERALAPVARRERVGAVHDAHHVERAAALVRGDAGVVLGALDEVADHGLVVVRARDLDLLLAVPDDALEVLGAVHGAGAAAAELVPVVVVDAGEAHELLAGLADDAGLRLLVRRAREDLVLGLERVHAPQVRGVVEGGALFADLEVDRPVGLALDDDDLVAGARELRREVAARVALAVAAGERRGEVQGVAVAAEHRRAAHGADDEDELVARAQRVDLGGDLFAEIVRADALCADELLDELRRHGLF